MHKTPTILRLLAVAVFVIGASCADDNTSTEAGTNDVGLSDDAADSSPANLDVVVTPDSDASGADDTAEVSDTAEVGDTAEVSDTADDSGVDSDPTDGSSSSDATDSSGADTSVVEDTASNDTSADTMPDVPATFRCESVSADCSGVERSATEHNMVAIDGCQFGLTQTWNVGNQRAIADELAAIVGGFTTLGEVLGDLNRTATPGITAGSADRLSNHDFLGFRWNNGDMGTTDWYPQGITGGSDAEEGGRPNGKRLILVSWYDHRDVQPSKGVRVSLADISDPNDVTYRHMLLVEPRRDAGGVANFGPAVTGSGGSLHAGGIAWVGDYLYVADTTQGFRVYDMSRIVRVNDVSDSSVMGRDGTTLSAHAYRYVVPQIARYQLAGDACSVRFSFVGLDRTATPPVLVSGEYHSSDVDGRLVSWPIDLSTGWLETDGDGDVVRGIDAAIGAQSKMQGALTYQGNTYISSSTQTPSGFGRLYRTRPGRTSSISAWVYGAEDLYMERDTNRIWTPAEHPDARDTVSIHRLDP